MFEVGVGGGAVAGGAAEEEAGGGAAEALGCLLRYTRVGGLLGLRDLACLEFLESLFLEAASDSEEEAVLLCLGSGL